MAVQYADIIKEIQQGKFAPVYFLQGEESFFIDSIINHIEATALDDDQKNFNQIVLYGKDTNLTEIIGTSRRYPMMGERQIVIVREAQELKGWAKEDMQILVANYLENPLSSTILVFGYKHKSMDKRTKIGKLLEKHTVFLNARKLYDNEVFDWIQRHCSGKGISIDRGAIMMLSENIGNNLQHLANEVDKLLLNVEQGQPVTDLMVQKYVGISKEYNIFELQKALGIRNQVKAFKIVNYFASSPSNNPLVLVIYSLFSYFSKLMIIHHSDDKNEKALAGQIGASPYFIKEYLMASRNYPLPKVIENIHHLHEADIQSKGIGHAPKKDGSVLTELVQKLIN